MAVVFILILLFFFTAAPVAETGNSDLVLLESAKALRLAAAVFRLPLEAMLRRLPVDL